MVIKQNGIKGTLRQPGAHSKGKGENAQTFISSSRGMGGSPGVGPGAGSAHEIIQKKTTTRNKIYQTQFVKKYSILRQSQDEFALNCWSIYFNIFSFFGMV